MPVKNPEDNLARIMESHRDRVVYEMRNESGYARMTRYKVFHGIDLSYNDVHMETISHNHAVRPLLGLFAIHHCQEGRIECAFHNGECLYMGQGDISIGWKSNSAYVHDSHFPCSHYHGIAIDMYVPKAQGEVDRMLGAGRIDLTALCNRFCRNKEFGMIMQENDSLKHLFYEIYHVPEEIKRDYFRLNVMEILLFLSAINDIPAEHRPYFAKVQVDKVKAVYKELTTHLERKMTIDEIAEKYDIAPTTLKECFKGVYGSSIYQYIKQYRMNEAAKQLLNTDDSILDIANRVGYENGSKFSAAFQKVMGARPNEYRKKK